MPHRYALLISNSHYQDSKLSHLLAPDGDATALAKVLKDPRIGAFDTIDILLDRPFSEIHQAIVTFFANKQPDDLVLLYFSGHGLQDENRRLFLAAADSIQASPRAKSIAATFVADEMSNSRSKRQVLVLDCCYSGAFSRGVKAAPHQSVGIETIFHSEGTGRVVMTASDATQYAFEDETVQGQGMRSVFTNHLVQGLETGAADTNNDGQISIYDWYQYAYNQVHHETPHQKPMIWNYGQQGEVLLARNPFWAATPTPSLEPSSVQTLVVDQLARGDYQTINLAIQNAQHGDRILVRAGLYLEALVIDKPLEIVGDGQLGDVRVHASDNHVIFFRTTAGIVRNLTLRQTGSGEFYAVNIFQGNLRLEGCDISSESSACVGICNNGTAPILHGNKIHDGRQSGIKVYDNGQGIIKNNEIWGNALSGIQIDTGGTPNVCDNKIYDNKIGVLVHTNGRGVIEKNEIWRNTLSGIEIRTGSTPSLYKNRIHHNKNCGIKVYDNGQGIIKNNEILGNVLSGIHIGTGGAPIVQDNKIYDGETCGICICDNGEGTIEDNEIWGNLYAGIEISTDGAPRLHGNKIHDCKQSGIYIHNNGQGVIDTNRIWGNTRAGVEITAGSAPIMHNNTIYQNDYEAIWIYTKGGGTFTNNDLRGNMEGAWNISVDSQPLVKKTNNYE